MRWQYQAHERRPNSSFGKEGTEGKCSCSKKKWKRLIENYIDMLIAHTCVEFPSIL